MLFRKLLIAFVMSALMLTGCSGSSETNESLPSSSDVYEDPSDSAEIEVVAINYDIVSSTSRYNDISVLVVVRNTGAANAYLENASIDIEKDGTLVDVIDYIEPSPRILSPGKLAFYAYHSITDLSANIEYDIIPYGEFHTTDQTSTTLEVEQFHISDFKYGGIEFIGRVQNSTSDEIFDPHIAFIAFDDGGVPVWGCNYSFSSITANSNGSLKFHYTSTPPFDSVEDIANYTYYAYSD